MKSIVLVLMFVCVAICTAAETSGTLADVDVDTDTAVTLKGHFEIVKSETAESEITRIAQEFATPAAIGGGSFKIYKFLNEADQLKLESELKSLGFKSAPAKATASKLKRFVRGTPTKGIFLAIAVGEGVALVQSVRDYKPIYPNYDKGAMQLWISKSEQLTDSQKVALMKEMESAEDPPRGKKHRKIIYGVIAGLLTLLGYQTLRWRKILR